MKINRAYYNFLFHPFHEEHSGIKKVAAAATHIFLSYATYGIYTAVWAFKTTWHPRTDLYIDLSRKGLAIFPTDLPKWINTLRLAYNCIKTLPAILPSTLEELDLSGNSLKFLSEKLPPNLQFLKVMNNRLVALPKALPKNLTFLDVSCNKLRVLPRALPNLDTLYVVYNKLYKLPEALPPSLEILWASDNRLRTLPENLPENLEVLYVRRNRLRALPQTLPNTLRKLTASENQLTVFPNLPRGIFEVDLQENQLTSVPDSILSLPDHVTIDLDDNRFSDAYVADFQARLSQHRLMHPGEGPTVRMSIYESPMKDGFVSLEEALDYWAQLFSVADGRNPPKNRVQLLGLDENQKIYLVNFLSRLRLIADFRPGEGSEKGRKNVILRVENMLGLASKNRAFKEAMIAEITQALDTCHDRVLLCFNHIEIVWRIHQPVFIEAYRSLCIRAQKYYWLIQYAKSLRYGEEIEMILKLHLDLKEEFDLPITTRFMSYPKCSGVTPEILSEARSRLSAITDEEHLCQSSYWKELLQAQNRARADQIQGKYVDLLEEAGDYCDLTKASEKSMFLEAHQELKVLIEEFNATGELFDYFRFCQFISKKREEAIAQLPSGV